MTSSVVNMTNPYQSPTEQIPTGAPPTGLIRNVFAAIAFFGGLSIAISGIDRFKLYGGFKSLTSMSTVAQGSAALWAFTHLLGILSAFFVCVGLVRRNNQMV